MEAAVKIAGNPGAWTVVCDDTCPVVRLLARVVKSLDRQKNVFTFIGKDDGTPQGEELIKELDQSPWSLLLVDADGERWHGPEAIPFILKHLPSGRLAMVAYLIPGTMWITRQLYYAVSRNRKTFSKLSMSAPPSPEPN